MIHKKPRAREVKTIFPRKEIECEFVCVCMRVKERGGRESVGVCKKREREREKVCVCVCRNGFLRRPRVNALFWSSLIFCCAGISL